MSNVNVRCSVANCAYWGNGNFCQASQIVVHSGAGQTSAPESMLEGALTSAVEQGALTSSAATSTETCCQTFVPRGFSSY
ncbi:MAG: DUF1540 domain-containing protein [Bacilli bacterium]